MYNSHLHRIEVITYDELVRIAEHVIDVNKRESGQAGEPATTGPPPQDQFDENTPF
jgi:hypothetical protein